MSTSDTRELENYINNHLKHHDPDEINKVLDIMARLCEKRATLSIKFQGTWLCFECLKRIDSEKDSVTLTKCKHSLHKACLQKEALAKSEFLLEEELKEFIICCKSKIEMQDVESAFGPEEFLRIREDYFNKIIIDAEKKDRIIRDQKRFICLKCKQERRFKSENVSALAQCLGKERNICRYCVGTYYWNEISKNNNGKIDCPVPDHGKACQITFTKDLLLNELMSEQDARNYLIFFLMEGYAPKPEEKLVRCGKCLSFYLLTQEIDKSLYKCKYCDQGEFCINGCTDIEAHRGKTCEQLKAENDGCLDQNPAVLAKNRMRKCHGCERILQFFDPRPKKCLCEETLCGICGKFSCDTEH